MNSRRNSNEKRVEVLIHIRLQPGDRECRKQRKPFRRFPDHSLTQLTWLKPGVNKTGLTRKKISRPSRFEVFFEQSPLRLLRFVALALTVIFFNGCAKQTVNQPSQNPGPAKEIRSSGDV